MSRSVTLRLLFVGFFIAALFTGCSRDPNVRKQKYLESGDRYFAKGKYREAEIQYTNAVQVDARFAQAHYQLGQTYLKLGDNRAFQELSRVVELAPDNYRARLDLANLLLTAQDPGGSRQDYLKQARTHLDILREKQPQKSSRRGPITTPPRTSPARPYRRCRKESPPTPAALSLIWIWPSSNSAPTSPTRPRPISRKRLNSAPGP